VECDVGIFGKISPIQAYIQLRRHKAIETKVRNVLTDRSQTSSANFAIVLIV
jgi:hypothetical protein